MNPWLEVGLYLALFTFIISFGIMIYRNMVIKKYKDMSKKYPKFVDIRLKTAEILEKYGIWDEAEAEYLEIIKFFPKYLEARIKLSDLYVKMGKVNLARAQLEEVLKLSDSYQKYYHKALDRIYELD